MDIVLTKLHKPSLGQHWVPRPRLLEQLEQGRERPATLICGPAGYGKSTLVGHWLETSELPSCWLSLDNRDNELRRFLTNTLLAIKTAFPDACPKISALVESPNLPPIQTLATTLINELEQSDERFILVLDDYHLLNDESINDFMVELLSHPPPKLHLVLICRYEPLLNLSSLRAAEKITEIRVRELRFDIEETKKFLQGSLGDDVDQALAEDWSNRTEGWVGGLVLAVLASRHGEVERGRRSEVYWDANYIREYLFVEILTQQSKDIRNYLLATSILDQFCGSLCDALCPQTSDEHGSSLCGHDFIQWACQQNVFLIPLDSKKYWYRFHHLFRDLLHNQLSKFLGHEEILLLHSRASHWFEKEGLIEEAILHALKSGDDLRAAEIFERYRYAQHDTDQWWVVEKCLAMFPPELVSRRPGLLLAQAWIKHDKYALNEIPPIIQQVETLLENKTTETTCADELDFFRGVVCYWQGEGHKSCGYLEKAVIPSERQRVKGLKEIYLSLARQMIGQEKNALESLIKQENTVDSSLPMLKSRLLLAHAFIFTMLGNLIQAEEAAKRVEVFVKKDDVAYTKGWAVYLQAATHLRSCNFDQAFAHFTRAVKNRYQMHTASAVDSIAGLVLTCQAQKKEPDVSEAMSEMLEFTLQTADAHHVSVAKSLQARLSLLQGDLDSALDWERSIVEISPLPPLFLWLEVPAITQVRVLAAEGSQASLQKADELLEKLRHTTQMTNNLCQSIEVQVLQVLAKHKLGHLDLALDILEQVLTNACVGRWVYPFAELGRPMIDLLEELKGRTVVAHQCNKLLNVLANGVHNQQSIMPGDEPPIAGKESVVWREVLTNREYEILLLLEKRMRDKEIADLVCISSHTVRSHLKNIFEKLGVQDRLGAVVKAGQLGFLKP
jgi:LuxR family maltose regulon positive regulatory protein